MFTGRSNLSPVSVSSGMIFYSSTISFYGGWPAFDSGVLTFLFGDGRLASASAPHLALLYGGFLSGFFPIWFHSTVLAVYLFSLLSFNFVVCIYHFSSEVDSPSCFPLLLKVTGLHVWKSTTDWSIEDDWSHSPSCRSAERLWSCEDCPIWWFIPIDASLSSEFILPLLFVGGSGLGNQTCGGHVGLLSRRIFFLWAEGSPKSFLLVHWLGIYLMYVGLGPVGPCFFNKSPVEKR